MATKQTETYVVTEDDKQIIKKVVTRVIDDNGREDVYIDTYVEEKETDEKYQTEHESYHASGAHNNDYIGSEYTTHVHNYSDGSTDTFDENNNKDKDSRDRTPYEP